MSKRIRSITARQAGFTLVELMITVVILSILVAIALPAYNSQVLRSHRTDAKTALLDLASREERYYSTANAYTNDQGKLAYGPAGVPWPAFPGLLVGNGYYQVFVQVFAAAPPAPAAYTITATAIGTQVNDTPCLTLSVNQLGQQLSTSGATCWQ
jgi:type IV pilus assembly protein PilE